MFGDISGMMSKIKDAQKNVEATKKRLNTVLIDEQTANGSLKITITANSDIKSIAIDESLLSDKEELEDYLILTLNKALKKAKEINEHELAVAAQDGMPNIPGMDMFK
ncbi:YbaB/EbfC family nucleoid-associated protein [Tenacibaculum piscium]|uniref:Nucleoid-associated protein TNO020_40010 n=1 Tax=Tenacibaculum piscium TaxID=1458515 RepID=A0A2H1YH52_9FLAO|nr:YbaB/EbfC family nucleoid-associated protein [Tenacibaculum piscium]MBE7630176.1 YbaB/EbfC family nucleoid-associated protein [Tenacibaculum piscium]MBE7671106.1 YbaB/EbfC family nucleoid-associated protein [Tenacibaculum piscium]MBE7685949.1 YbaB/EbfC family nucleoid-associated protein [Tenacibaculum piscium]MBE7690927.1 YbaB/EbfC family nucleoid-associated protein [Tenacibaculum piscium]MCG8184149.1 YbaB/EbfC family nucleoid-associated protein [Tenacibaculum piscium]